VKKHILLLLLLFANLSLTAYGQLTRRSLILASNRTAFFLKQAQTESGAIEDSTNALFNVWETILVADALLDHFPLSDTTVKRAVKWLKSIENEDRLICHNELCRERFCIETSALYIQLLARLSTPAEQQEKLSKINSLQEKNGSWQVGNPDVYYKTDFPSVTGFVLNLFDALDYKSPGIDSAYHFLLNHQLENGSWGQEWEYYGCSGYALWQCLPAIKRCSFGKEAFEKAKAFVLSQQLPDGSWPVTETGNTNHISAELQTAFMLICLQPETDEVSKKAIEKGISYLLSKQLPSGAWEGGLFPIPGNRYKKYEYLIATALIYKLLIAAQNDME
jgi:squalene cyclase